jgi:hypothetical protein
LPSPRLPASFGRRRALTALTVVVVTFELVAATAHLGHIARKGYDALSAPADPAAQADLDTLAYYVSPAAIVLARSLIPPHATYSVIVPSGNENGVLVAFKSALLPRVFRSSRHRADWVIAYQVSSEHQGLHYSQEIGLAPDVNLLKIER